MEDSASYKKFAIRQRIEELLKALSRVPKNSEQWWARKSELDQLKKDLNIDC